MWFQQIGTQARVNVKSSTTLDTVPSRKRLQAPKGFGLYLTRIRKPFAFELNQVFLDQGEGLGVPTEDAE